MSEIHDLETRIKERLDMNEAQRRLRQSRVEDYMNGLEERMKRYTAMADRLMETVIRPRLEVLARHIPGLLPVEERTGRHVSVYRCERTDRMPATVTLEMGITRDGEVQTLSVFYNLQVIPVLFSFDGSDQLIMPFDMVDEGRITNWVNEHIIRVVDTCLRLETADMYQADNLVTDPVCGMRINKAIAPASMEHEGQRYYFCVEACRARFAEDPDHYLSGSGRVVV
jgi:YHS domain-containing protein